MPGDALIVGKSRRPRGQSQVQARPGLDSGSWHRKIVFFFILFGQQIINNVIADNRTKLSKTYEAFGRLLPSPGTAIPEPPSAANSRITRIYPLRQIGLSQTHSQTIHCYWYCLFQSEIAKNYAFPTGDTLLASVHTSGMVRDIAMIHPRWYNKNKTICQCSR